MKPLIALVLPLAIVGCAQEDPSADTTSETTVEAPDAIDDALLGTWTTQDGNSILTFEADRTYTTETTGQIPDGPNTEAGGGAVSNSTSGEWGAEDGELVRESTEGVVTVMDYSVEEDTLTLVRQSSGTEFVYSRQE